MRELSISGAWEVHEPVLPDDRGHLVAWYKAAAFRHVAGHDLSLAQANYSVSRRGVLRGIHFADVPPGQAKYVTCVHGSVVDVAVDLRVGSPTFRRWHAVPLDEGSGKAVYLAEGLGHAFLALTEGATVVYLCSEAYAPSREHGVHPLDPGLGIRWPVATPVLSEKDASAPTLAEAERDGLLPRYEDCLAYVTRLRSGEY